MEADLEREEKSGGWNRKKKYHKKDVWLSGQDWATRNGRPKKSVSGSNMRYYLAVT